jgi:hypothetical protein
LVLLVLLLLGGCVRVCVRACDYGKGAWGRQEVVVGGEGRRRRRRKRRRRRRWWWR